METNHEKFLRLRKKNKLRLARNKLIEDYWTKFGVFLKEDEVYGIEQKHQILEKVYEIDKLSKNYTVLEKFL